MRTAIIVSWIVGVAVAETRGWSAFEVSPQGAPSHILPRDGAAVFQEPPKVFESEPPLEGVPSTPGARFKRTKYGPLTMKPKTHVDEMIPQVPKPCTECWITAFQTELVYKDNNKANLNDGLDLRHMVLYNTNKQDLACPGDNAPARIHASGNQRETSRMNPRHALYGMEIGPPDNFRMSFNITNDSDQTRVVYVQMIYEAIEKPAAKGYKQAQMAWIDLQGCNTATLPDTPGAYAIRSPDWQATVSGKILSVIGHISDGGTDVTLYVNNAPVCTHNVLYGKKYGFMESDASMQHITDISICRRFGHIRSGDAVSIAAGFDSNKHSIMTTGHGGAAHMMAMSRIYLTDSL